MEKRGGAAQIGDWTTSQYLCLGCPWQRVCVAHAGLEERPLLLLLLPVLLMFLLLLSPSRLVAVVRLQRIFIGMHGMACHGPGPSMHMLCCELRVYWLPRLVLC